MYLVFLCDGDSFGSGSHLLLPFILCHKALACGAEILMCGPPLGPELELYKHFISYEMTLAAEVRPCRNV